MKRKVQYLPQISISTYGMKYLMTPKSQMRFSIDIHHSSVVKIKGKSYRLKDHSPRRKLLSKQFCTFLYNHLCTFLY